MISVGVRDLKNQLSQYLQLVKDGKRVIITEHNKIIAEISLPKEELGEDHIELELLKLEKEGKLIKAKRNISLTQLSDTSTPVDWKKIYDETREDRN
ncbi:hypothetical protein MASR2M78_15840 [Treponema sp.]